MTLTRRMRMATGVIALTVCLTLQHAALAQDFRAADSVAASRIPDLTSKLERLNTADPRGYFELGEEVASEAGNAGDRDLAKRLFVLSFELERSRPAGEANTSLMASNCLALVQMADNEGDRRWLGALAASLTDTHVRANSADAPVNEPAGVKSDLALDAATVIGLVRNGQGTRAARLLAKPGVAPLIEKYERLLSPGQLPGGLSMIKTIIDQWPTCLTCRGRRSVKEGGFVRLCSYCLGRPGPKLSPEQLTLFLRTEAAILSGAQRSWAASALVDAGAPVRDADPAELAPTLGVDVSHPIFRAGKWIEDAAPQTGAKSPPGRSTDQEKARTGPTRESGKVE